MGELCKEYCTQQGARGLDCRVSCRACTKNIYKKLTSGTSLVIPTAANCKDKDQYGAFLQARRKKF